MLNSGFAQDINIYIGEENEKEELKDFSVITFKHKVGNKEVGTSLQYRNIRPRDSRQ